MIVLLDSRSSRTRPVPREHIEAGLAGGHTADEFHRGRSQRARTVGLVSALRMMRIVDPHGRTSRPSDEYMHELGPESNFNESMYINCFDPAQQVGGWFRIGNRANEGYAEMTVCLYLPPEATAPTQVGFMFKRPAIDNNDAFDAGGLTWTMVTPFEELRIDYDGKVVLLDEPEQMANPKEAFTEQPLRRVRGPPHLHRPGSTEHVRRRARHAARGTGRGVRQGPLRAARRRRTAPSASATASGRSTATACATTRGARATGRRRGTTAGSPPTWARTSASWPAASPRGTAPAPAAGSCGRTARCTCATTCRSAPRPRGDEQLPRPHRGRHALQPRSDREWKFTGEVTEPHPAAQPPPDPDGNWLMTRISEGITKWTIDTGEFEGQVGYGLASTSTRSSTATPSVSPSSRVDHEAGHRGDDASRLSRPDPSPCKAASGDRRADADGRSRPSARRPGRVAGRVRRDAPTICQEHHDFAQVWHRRRTRPGG